MGAVGNAARFWEMHGSGEGDDAPENSYRWYGSSNLLYDHLVLLCRGKEVDSLPVPVVCDMQTAGPREDSASVHLYYVVVSQRARVLIERLDPDAAQFLPALMIHNGQPCSPEQYWVVNWLRLLDAMDYERSLVGLRGQPGETILTPAIDPNRVPPEAMFFRISGYDRMTIIRDAARQAIRKARLTGFVMWPCR